MSEDLATDAHLAALLRGIEAVGPEKSAALVEELGWVLEAESAAIAKLVSDLVALSSKNPVLHETIVEIGQRVGKYAGQSLRGKPHRQDVDVLIITVKEPELLAALAAFGLEENSEKYTVAPRMRYWTWQHEGLKYALSNVGESGNVHTTLRVLDLAQEFSPRFAVLIGMAAGVPNKKIHRGDVVVANLVYNYEFARLTNEGLRQAAEPYTPWLPNVDPLRSDSSLRQWRRTSRSAVGELRQKFSAPGAMPPVDEVHAAPMNVKIDAIMAGGWLIESNLLGIMAQEISDNVVATEMEGAGFAAAARHLKWHWLVVRGIADSGEPGRDTAWQRLATYYASTYVRDVLLKHVIAESDGARQTTQRSR